MNWKTAAAIATIVLLIVGVTACRGYTFSDYIDVQTPPDIRESTGAAETVPLSQAPFVRQQYVDDVKVNLAQFDQNIQDAQLFADFVGGLLNTGLELAEGPLQGIPMGGVIFAALGGLGGLFLRKPGTQKEIDSTWDEAFEAGRGSALEGVIQGAKSAKPDNGG